MRESNESYHADLTYIGSSMLKCFRESVPMYHGMYVAGTIPRPQPTESQRLGTFLHCAVLEPEDWQHRIVTDKFDGRTKAGKEAKANWEQYRIAHPDSLIINAAEEETVEAMLASLLAHTDVRAALEAQGVCEQSIRWVDEASGVRLKARPDKLLHNGLILDLKTTSDPSPQAFARSCAAYAYHCQAAFYLEGVWRHYNADGPFMFVAVGNKPPHEVGAYILDDEDVNLGRRLNESALRELAECQASGVWQSRLKGVQKIMLPRWAQREAEYQS